MIAAGSQLSASEASLRNTLQVKVRNYATNSNDTVLAYRETDGGLYVPRAFAVARGIANDSNISLSIGDRLRAPRTLPELRGHQHRPVNDVVRRFDRHYDLIFQAYTGSGKTVMGCTIAARLGRKTLILVDQERIMDQWVVTLNKLFGYEVSEVGIVQGSVAVYERCGFVIAMIQTLYNRQYHSSFYERFGTVIFDEYQVCGADQFSNVLGMFPARYRLGLSATDRKDAKQKLIEWHLGSDRVVLAEGRPKSQARYVEYTGNIPSWYAQISPKDGRYVSELVADSDRNALITRLVHRLYQKHRNLLVIGARIHHLECLASMAVLAGVPREDILVYTGRRNTWRFRKVLGGHKRPEHWEKGTEYTPIQFRLYETKTDMRKQAALLDSARIIFTTYSVFGKAVDVPHLDAGIDVTPRANFVQVHGRILRVAPDKLTPIWVTIRDRDSFRAEYQFAARVAEFVKSNAEVFLWDLERGLQKQEPARLLRDVKRRVEALKAHRISGNEHERNIVAMPTTGNARKTLRGGRT
jgi:superfamily II DNA or RNA helicase